MPRRSRRPGGEPDAPGERTAADARPQAANPSLPNLSTRRTGALVSRRVRTARPRDQRHPARRPDGPGRHARRRPAGAARGRARRRRGQRRAHRLPRAAARRPQTAICHRHGRQEPAEACESDRRHGGAVRTARSRGLTPSGCTLTSSSKTRTASTPARAGAATRTRPARRRRHRTRDGRAHGGRIVSVGQRRRGPRNAAIRRRRARGRRARPHGRAGLRRSAHAPRVRRRSPRRAAAAAGRRHLRGDRRGRRRHRQDRCRRRAPPPRTTGRRAPCRDSRDARLRHDDGRGQERLRPGDGDRAAHAARHSARWPDGSRSSWRRRSWARTRFRSSTAIAASEYVRLVVEEMIPAVAAEGLAEWCDVFCEHGVFTPEESARILQAGAALRPEAAHPRRRARAERRVGGGRRCRRALRRSPDLRRRAARASAGRARRDRHAAADGGVLSEARPLRAGAHADRRRRAGGARDRRQSGRRLLRRRCRLR